MSAEKTTEIIPDHLRMMVLSARDQIAADRRCENYRAGWCDTETCECYSDAKLRVRAAELEAEAVQQ